MCSQFVKGRTLYNFIADENFSYKVLALKILAQKPGKCTYKVFALSFVRIFISE